MATPFSMGWVLITEGKEKRLDPDDNLFEVTFDGYQLFPMHEHLEVRRHLKSDQIGTANIEQLTLKDGRTICHYRLVSLYSVN
ncbi:hypothetical protein AAV35_006355 [Salimicrobium jeotgali]|uniref:DUF2584 domain-containing protein n=2 Tax=Salimicrobium TaxID=351195 RepID=K2GEM3_9BACI|nr:MULTISPECIES: DUF2584 domain-containing protein [Salimicrobium]AKG04443.1 hypothetical protein AAV35_006355 [Salimicrobium jeotgali]EKE32647.1 hypothetical protein MJ3_01777 [Salimicrobium jeotgali]MBM7695370.1 hypothetical protein [Salimicrobium jeotgali]PBB05420.1 DUF2584 domain-containing protein [Salimicrobium humidisoli]